MVAMILALVFLLITHLDVSLAGQQTVSLDLKDADVPGTIRLLAETGGLDVVISQEVKGTVTVRWSMFRSRTLLRFYFKLRALG